MYIAFFASEFVRGLDGFVDWMGSWIGWVRGLDGFVDWMGSWIGWSSSFVLLLLVLAMVAS